MGTYGGRRSATVNQNRPQLSAELNRKARSLYGSFVCPLLHIRLPLISRSFDPGCIICLYIVFVLKMDAPRL